MAAEWIVIVATVAASNALLVPDVYSSPAINLPSTYSVPLPPAPTISVYRAASKAEAEDIARGYKVTTLEGGIQGVTPVRPDAFGWSSCAAVIITPDGKAYRVTSVERKRKVMREVEESDGWSTVWDEIPASGEQERRP